MYPMSFCQSKGRMLTLRAVASLVEGTRRVLLLLLLLLLLMLVSVLLGASAKRPTGCASNR
jgi:hypothetical protein